MPQKSLNTGRLEAKLNQIVNLRLDLRLPKTDQYMAIRRPPHEIEAAKLLREERQKEENIKNAASSAKTTTESNVVPIDAAGSAQRSLVPRQGSKSLEGAATESQTSHEHSTAVVVESRFQPGMTAAEDNSVNVLASS